MMKQSLLGTILYYLCLLVLICYKGAEGACDANSNNKVIFQEVNSTKWDRTWTPITEDGKRPLGFMKGTVYFNTPSKPNPCIQVTGTSGRHIHILVESPTGNVVWFKNQDGDEQRCEKTTSSCPRATANDMFYEFFLDTSRGSSESDVSFWYKFTKGPTGAEDPEGMWCANQQEEYPSSLQPLPTNLVPTDSTRGPVGSASRGRISIVLLLTLCVFCRLVVNL